MIRIVCFLQVCALLLLAASTWGSLPKNDIVLYRTVCEELGHGQQPYTDFPLEYPPLAALVFAGPSVLGAFHWHAKIYYYVAFLLQNALLAAAATPVILKLSRRMNIPDRVALWRYSALLLLLFVFVLLRYDIFPTLATLLALMCLVEDRPLAAGGWLGMGIATKLYPIVLLPLFVAYELCRRRFSAAARIVSAACVPGVLSLMPWLMRGSTAFLSFLRYHKQRGLQWETLPAGWIMLAARFKCTTAAIVDEFGAKDIYSPWTSLALKLQPVIMAISLLAILAIVCQRMRHEAKRDGSPRLHTLSAGIVALLLVFIITNKVLSPQYLVWIVLFATLLRPKQWWGVLAVCAMTTALYFKGYHRLQGFYLDAVLLLNIRNATAVGLIIAISIKEFRPGRLDGSPCAS